MYVIFSYPRQGTDWFMKSCGFEHNKISYNIKYFREYFNLIVNRRHQRLFRFVHGTEINSEQIFYESFNKEFEQIIEKSWNRDCYSITKENFSYTKVPLFKKYCKECIILYRHRKYTFPTSRIDYVDKIYNSFIYNDYANHKFKLLKTFCLENNFTNTIVLSHIIAFTFLFYYADQYNIPVINWEDLISLDKEKLGSCLSFVDNNVFSDNISNTRISISEMKEKEHRYNTSYSENECNLLLNYIKKLDIISKKHFELLR